MPARACLLLLVCACVRGSLLTAKEFICKDPDTGTLHAVNSTWRSTTFCGNYTCKMRTVDTSSGMGPPTSKIIVNLTGPQARIPHNDISVNQGDINYSNDFSLSKLLPDLSKDNDRLLNKAEIRKISELLHTVKKSDLQAVIELYNVAQEIYKGMKVGMHDVKDTDETDYDSNEKSRASESKLEDLTKPVENKVSYWYEPVNGFRKEGDMKSEGSEYTPTTAYSARRQYEPPFFYAPKNANYPSYFSGTLLSNDDFGRLGYYHPQANFQSLASYYQQKNGYDVAGTTQNTPCNPCPRVYQYPTPMPANTGSITSYPSSQGPANNRPQPYPPSSYNYSAYGYNHYNSYYKGNPWAYYDYYRNLPYQTAAQVQKNPVVVKAEILANTGEHQKTDDAKNLITKNEDENSWKTDPLSEAVINEIRANIAERGKLLNIPLKKRIKLERAAKVIKLDQFNNRQTRSVSVSTKVDGKETISEAIESRENKKEKIIRRSPEAVETYIEKMTCEPTTELGFFRIGNMTRPYPECCPQKIEDKQR